MQQVEKHVVLPLSKVYIHPNFTLTFSAPVSPSMRLVPLVALDGNGTAQMGPALEDPWNLEGN